MSSTRLFLLSARLSLQLAWVALLASVLRGLDALRPLIRPCRAAQERGERHRVENLD